ncbi:MAG: sulfate adenylyltransferase, partial [Actinomycetota bacterium]
MTEGLIAPYGGRLVELMVDGRRAGEIQKESRDWPSWTPTPRQLCDLELLLNGGFSPLRGFMPEDEYLSVCSSMRLPDGTLWPIPITLDVSEELAAEVEHGSRVALRDSEGVMLAALSVEDVFKADHEMEASSVFGTTNPEHPGVAYLSTQANRWCLGGKLEGIHLPIHYDFKHLRLTPAELRDEFLRMGWQKVVAFQTRNPMHRAHQELTLRAAAEAGASLLVHPVVGMTKPGDVDHYTRVRCYQALLHRYPPYTAKLSLLPLAMRMAGPKEALWHAIIRRNHGCTHLIVGRDHAGPGKDSSGESFYGPYDAQALLEKHQDEIGVQMVPFRNMVYVEDLDTYLPEDEVPNGASVLSIS